MELGGRNIFLERENLKNKERDGRIILKLTSRTHTITMGKSEGKVEVVRN
jgi:hypothetical protein